MRRPTRSRLTARTLASLALAGVGVLFASCARDAESPTIEQRAAGAKSPAVERAARRAYDGAPPIRPHESFGMACTECHNEEGREVEGVGFSPPSPHEKTAGLSALSNCSQCHVPRTVDEPWRESEFAGLPQDLRAGRRFAPGAPPVMPHSAFMRENCQACHTGPAAREEIRTTHPERPRCRQCHVEQQTLGEFPASSRLGSGSAPKS